MKSSTRTRLPRGMTSSTTFPAQQLFVLALCRICEPIAFMSIFPYAYYMIASFHITNDEKSIAMYAGMITSSFAFAEFSTGVFWGRISDKFGRKPVLLMGLAGTGLSMLVFGLSPNIWMALIARALGGLLNGNIGVINTTVAEVVTNEAHQSRAFSIMPGIWCIGSIVGAGLGGTLADPVHNYPGYFAHDSIFRTFPYLLPNLVCFTVVICSLIVGFLFLEETHEDKRLRRDIGLEIGDWLLSFRTKSPLNEKTSILTGDYSILHDSDDRSLDDYSSMDSSPALLPTTTVDPSDMGLIRSDVTLEAGMGGHGGTGGLSGAFTSQVVIVIVSYGLLAFHTISAEQLLPVMLSMPHSSTSNHLPFFFTGGFELPTKTIGTILSISGIIQTIAVLVVFPLVSQRLGSLRTFRLAVLSYPLFYVLVPYLSILPDHLKVPVLYVFIVWKVTAQAFALPPIQILLANSAPSKKVLGTLNGTAASSASLCRAFGPTLSGLLQSAGLSFGCLGLPWWSSSVIALVAAILSLQLSEQKRTSRSPSLPKRNRIDRVDSFHALVKQADADAKPLLSGDCMPDMELTPSEPTTLPPRFELQSSQKRPSEI